MKPLIIAHRGASAHAPENTIAAFRKAVEAGADGIEFDVRLSKDGTPVVFHDRTLKRISGEPFELIDLSLDDLADVDVGKWFDETARNNGAERFSGERIPTLSSTLEYLRAFGGTIYIELKGKDQHMDRLTKAVAAELNANKMAGRIIIKSFKLSAIPMIRLLAPDVTTAALFAPKIRNLFRKDKYLVRIGEEIGAGELSVHLTLASRKLLRSAERSGMSVAVWTADNPRWVKRAIRLGINALITNDPALLLNRRNELTNPGV